MKLRYFKFLKKSQAVVKSPFKQLSSAISCQRLSRLAGSAFFVFTTVSSQGLLLLYTPNSSKVAAQTATPALCANPGKDGAVTPTGTVNTYYPGTATANAGATSITLGTSTGATTGIAAGDLLLVIQMQDAAINSNNTTAYGANNGSSSGSTSLNNSGLYEYVVATNSVATSGGTLTIRGTGTSNGLINAYTNANFSTTSTTQGQRRFQVVRVPQYSNITTLNSVTAAAWNGTSGGVVAIDVAANLSGGSINVSGQGFRGGGGRRLAGIGTATGFASTDHRTSSANNVNGSKGEGIVGMPRFLYNAATSAVTDNSSANEGYPSGSYARGAPGNAGGGGNDSNPATNDQNSGGGGGGNGGAGGKGGNSWSSGATVGGFGGAAFTATGSRVVFGGGGGAGNTNDGTSDPNTNTTGINSSGAAGGGIVMLRTGSISGSATISANGANALNVLNDGGGGGGAGGSVVVTSASGSLAGLTVNAQGGKGGNAWASNTGGTANRHGPGGGGGGGFIAYSSLPSINVNGGANGITTTLNDAFGATVGTNGTTAAISPSSIPGASSGAECLSSISGTLYRDNNTNNTFDSGTDSPLPANITVTLYNDANNNNRIDTGEQVGLPVTTNASGNYTFTGVFNGTYKIKVDTADTDIPSGYAIATSNDLLVTVNSANITGQNFGFVSLPSSFGSCSASPYISYNNPNTLGSLNINTLNLDTVGNGTIPYNAIGYNIVDNLIYGIRRTTATAEPYTNSNELVVIGSNGVPVILGAVNGLPLSSLYNSGDVAANNVYYVVNGLVTTKTFYRIDINPTSPTYKQVISQFNLSNYNTTGFSFGDIAFNPVDGQIYAVLNILTNNAITSQQLIKIDPSNGTTSTVGTASATTTDLDSFIGLFVDNTGYIYGYQGALGKMWRYDRTTGARVLLVDGLPNASNNADGARCYNAAPISVAPRLLLVKRITAINTTSLTTVVDDPNDSSDNHSKWPAGYLKGVTSQNDVKPGDVVEYTVYFLSTGSSDASKANLCDLIPANTTFFADAFATGRGIKSSLGTTTTDLTNANDTDKGRFYASTETAPTSCRVGQTVTNGNGTRTLVNAKGAVVVDLGTVTKATTQGTANSYGFVKFQVKVD